MTCKAAMSVCSLLRCCSSIQPRPAQKKEEDSEIIRAIRSTKMGGRELLALLDNIQAGNVTFLTAVNNASEEAETEEAIEKDA